jgi:ribosome-associated translation inhibitor RaiA
MQLKHQVNVFLEDAIHDYVWVGNGVRLHRRTGIEKGVWVVVEYDDTPTAYVLEVVVDFDGTKAAIEVKSKDADPDLDGAIDSIVDTLKKKIRTKIPRSICGDVKIVRHGPGWHKDPWSYGSADQRADAMLKLRMRLHETFPSAKDGSAYDWNGKLVDKEWADVNTYTAKQKEMMNNENTIGG